MFLGVGYHPWISDRGHSELWFHIPHNASQVMDPFFLLVCAHHQHAVQGFRLRCMSG
jgi:hypothetical protein